MRCGKTRGAEGVLWIFGIHCPLSFGRTDCPDTNVIGTMHRGGEIFAGINATVNAVSQKSVPGFYESHELFAKYGYQ